MADGGTMTGNPDIPPEAAIALDPHSLRAAFGRFATGVTVVTTQTADGPMGMTANSFASVSLYPPLVLWSPARASGRFPHFAGARHYAIHVLGAEQVNLCHRFTRGGAGFHGLSQDISPEGVPLKNDTLARFECVQHATFDGGDHLIILGQVLRATLRDGDPLIFAQGSYGRFTASL